MKRVFASVFVLFLSSPGSFAVGADEPTPSAIVDKGIKALGGEEKLKKAVAMSWKTKGLMSIQGNDIDFSSQAMAQGIDKIKSELELDFNGNAMKATVVMSGDKGWRRFGDNTMEMDNDAIANEKHSLAMQLIPVTLLALKGKDFKLASVPEQKVADKPALGVKITEPSGKEFTLFFDKESGLPVKSVGKIVGWQGEENEVETTYANYKEFDGIKKATKVKSKRDGEPFMESEISDFKVLDKAPAETFVEPK
jgi:hypothetical protein